MDLEGIILDASEKLQATFPSLQDYSTEDVAKAFGVLIEVELNDFCAEPARLLQRHSGMFWREIAQAEKLYPTDEELQAIEEEIAA